MIWFPTLLIKGKFCFDFDINVIATFLSVVIYFIKVFLEEFCTHIFLVGVYFNSFYVLMMNQCFIMHMFYNVLWHIVFFFKFVHFQYWKKKQHNSNLHLLLVFDQNQVSRLFDISLPHRFDSSCVGLFRGSWFIIPRFAISSSISRFLAVEGTSLGRWKVVVAKKLRIMLEVVPCCFLGPPFSRVMDGWCGGKIYITNHPGLSLFLSPHSLVYTSFFVFSTLIL